MISSFHKKVIINGGDKSLQIESIEFKNGLLGVLKDNETISKICNKVVVNIVAPRHNSWMSINESDKLKVIKNSATNGTIVFTIPRINQSTMMNKFDTKQPSKIIHSHLYNLIRYRCGQLEIQKRKPPTCF